MNELIRELWAQCVVKHTKTPMNWQDVADEFAELIVRECQFAIVSRTDLPKHERKLYNNVLKQHFGVEDERQVF